MGKNYNMNGNQMQGQMQSSMTNMNMQYNNNMNNNYNGTNTLQYKGGLNSPVMGNGNDNMEGFRNLNKNVQSMYSSPQLNVMNPNMYNPQLQNKKLEDNSNINGKYTCRFEIQIENDKDFQVARRLIGSKVNFILTNKGLQYEKDS
jgi:hypothetical protein